MTRIFETHNTHMDDASISSYSPIVADEEAIRASFVGAAGASNIAHHADDSDNEDAHSALDFGRIPHVDSIATFSSVEAEDEEVEGGLFERFEPVAGPSAGAGADSSTSICAPSQTPAVSPTEPLNVRKVRTDGDSATTSVQTPPPPAKAVLQSQTTRTFTPTTKSTPPSSRIAELETELSALRAKSDKLVREIAVVERLLRDAPPASRETLNQTLSETQRLRLGLVRLRERDQDTRKAAYELGTRIAKLRRAEPAGVTDYFVRKASLDA